jgi:hypothetical protein
MIESRIFIFPYVGIEHLVVLTVADSRQYALCVLFSVCFISFKDG